MSFTEVLTGLGELTTSQRQILIRRAIELDEPPLSESEEALVEARLAAHRAKPESSVPLDEMTKRLRARSQS